MSKFQLKCSCTICHKETTVQSLKSHLAKHIPKTTKCQHCSTEFEYRWNQKFCNSSCAAKHINPTRSCKTGPKPGTNKGRIKVCKFNYCQQCSSIIKHSNNKTCSSECRKLQMSQKAKLHSQHVRLNRNPNKQSWMERSFTDWLVQKGLTINVDFIPEYKIHNPDGNRTYFADFYFPKSDLIIELDGTQHKETIVQDQRRDYYISTLGIRVFRISHTEYKKQTKLSEVIQLVGAATGA